MDVRSYCGKLIVALLVAFTLLSAASEAQVVYVRNKPFKSAVNIAGTTYVPFREVMRTLRVDWTVASDGTVQTSEGSGAGPTLRDASFVLVGKGGQLPINGLFRQGDAWVPLASLAKPLGLTLEYDKALGITELVVSRQVTESDRKVARDLAQAEEKRQAEAKAAAEKKRAERLAAKEAEEAEAEAEALESEEASDEDSEEIAEQETTSAAKSLSAKKKAKLTDGSFPEEFEKSASAKGEKKQVSKADKKAAKADKKASKADKMAVAEDDKAANDGKDAKGAKSAKGEKKSKSAKKAASKQAALERDAAIGKKALEEMPSQEGPITIESMRESQEVVDKAIAEANKKESGTTAKPEAVPEAKLFVQSPRANADFFTGQVTMTATVVNSGTAEAKGVSAKLTLRGSDGSVWSTQTVRYGNLPVDGVWNIRSVYNHLDGSSMPRGVPSLKVDLMYAK